MATVRRLWTAVGLLHLCACSPCENEVIHSVPAPSGRLKAVVFHRGCGATVGINTQVSIVEARRELPDDGGNVLIVDDEAHLALQWMSDTTIAISGVPAHQCVKKEVEVAGVNVRYY